MKGKMKQERIDAVKMMRRIRSRLSKQYEFSPEKEKVDLDEIRKKYGIKFRIKEVD